MIDAVRQTDLPGASTASPVKGPAVFRLGSRRGPAKPKPQPIRSTSQSRARLSRVLLVYVLGMVCIIAFVPLEVTLMPNADILTIGERIGIVVSQALLFVPLGFLFPLTWQEWDPSPLPVFVLGLVVGGCIAATRPIEGEWAAPIVNSLANGLGAGAGAWLLRAANRRIQESARLAGRLSLEIPLVALIYLLLPLVLATSLTAVDQPLLAMSLIPLGLLGARLISTVQEHHFGPGGAFRTRGMAVVAGGWTVLGVFPIVLSDPAVGAGLVLLVGLATAHEASIPAVHGGSKERRFEAEALRSAVPYVGVYLATAILLPLSFGMSGWHIAIGLTGSDGDRPTQLIRLLEPMASLTVLGYMLAEARGRRERPFRETVWRIAAECGLVALAFEGSRAMQRDVGASVVQLALMVGASVLGAGIYHSQRERIHWILIHKPGEPPAVSTAEVQRAGPISIQ